jgi:hypothetical protein
MGLITSKAGLVLLDDWSEQATFRLGAFDRLDVSVYVGDALLQFLTPQGSWEPADGLLVRHGLFRSLTGLTLAYGPTGPRGVRAKREVAGVATTIDLELWGLD